MSLNCINGFKLALLAMREIYGSDEEPPMPKERDCPIGRPAFGTPEKAAYDYDWARNTLKDVEHTYNLHRVRLGLPHLFDANIKKVVFDFGPDIEFEAENHSDGLLKAALIVWRRLLSVETVALKPAPKRPSRK
ncbi:MAG: hypothetical protein ACYTDT_10410 [Planctomycetota bacterium]